LDHSYEVLSLTAYEGTINVQEKINKYFTEKEYIECQSCKSNRIISISMKSHLLIELLSLPKGILYRSNDQWEVYDDLKDGVSLATKNKVNIEMLLYTK